MELQLPSLYISQLFFLLQKSASTKIKKPPVPVTPIIEPPIPKEMEDYEGDGALEVDEDNDEVASDDKDVLEEDLNSLTEGLTTQDPAKLKSMEISVPSALFL